LGRLLTKFFIAYANMQLGLCSYRSIIGKPVYDSLLHLYGFFQFTLYLFKLDGFWQEFLGCLGEKSYKCPKTG
jgi:hypothetical protein